VALYLQWAKFWGMSLPEGERLSVFKLATKKGGSDKSHGCNSSHSTRTAYSADGSEHQGNSGNSGSSYH